MTSIGSVSEKHREPLSALLRSTREFNEEEVAVALELVDACVAGSAEYEALVAEDGEALRGYVCFGRTPMTEGTWDLYWIAVDPLHRHEGIGRALLTRTVEEVRRSGGRLIRVETSGQAAYEATRAFYERSGFETVARVREFYRPGDDLVVYGRYL